MDEESITGEESDTYALTDDDAGERIRTLVTFYDDEEERETAIAPATSFIVPEASRILVTNFNQPGSRHLTTTNISSGFISGDHPNGYAIDRIVIIRAFNTPASSDDAEFRLYTSTSDSDARERRPDTRIMTISDPNRFVTSNIWFNARSRVKLDPSTTYHAAAYHTHRRNDWLLHNCRRRRGQQLSRRIRHPATATTCTRTPPPDPLMTNPAPFRSKDLS